MVDDATTEGAACQTPPPICGVSEVVLSVADLPIMSRFYQQVLGFPLHSQLSMQQETPDPDGEPTIVFLKIADLDTALGRVTHPQLLVLIDYQRHVFARGRFHGHDVHRSTLNHLAFEIPPDSYQQHMDHLRAIGLQLDFSDFPALQARAIFFRDPEGNRLELICHTPMNTWAAESALEK